MLGIRSQKAKMLEAGLRESDFTPLCDAITDAFKQHDFATIEADLLFKFADVNNDGVVTEVLLNIDFHSIITQQNLQKNYSFSVGRIRSLVS